MLFTLRHSDKNIVITQLLIAPFDMLHLNFWKHLSTLFRLFLMLIIYPLSATSFEHSGLTCDTLLSVTFYHSFTFSLRAEYFLLRISYLFH